MSKDWFAVDKEGLSKVLARRGKGFVVNELIQNAWDTQAKNIVVTLEPLYGRAMARLTVIDDDPDGFADLRHAYTLYAESVKKADPEKRGRYNLGEKLVLALCKNAVILSTKGGIAFNDEGRKTLRTKTQSGSSFAAFIRLTREEIEEVESAIRMLIPPPEVKTIFNGVPLKERPELESFEMSLSTEIADEEGMIRRTVRTTRVTVHEVLPGEKASIYEMGIPIVETGDRWHYNIGQKVPLNADRDNVTPAYLQSVRVEVLNRMQARITKEDSTSSWVRDASADENVSKEAVEKVVTLRFGEKRVIFDPSDPEGTKIAMSQGYTVIPPGSLSGEEWKNVKRHEVARPAGQVTPSPKPFSPDGKPLRLLEAEEHTAGMRKIAGYAQKLAELLFGHSIAVKFASDKSWPFNATYGGAELTFNVAHLGTFWFDRSIKDDEVNKLLIHEFGHNFSGDHLSDDYHRGLSRIGAELMRLALEHPEIWKD